MVYDELMKMMEMLLMMVMICAMGCFRIRIVAAMAKSTFAMPLKSVRDFPLPVLMPNVIPGSLRMGLELDSHQRAEAVVVNHPSPLIPSMSDLLLECLKKQSKIRKKMKISVYTQFARFHGNFYK